MAQSHPRTDRGTPRNQCDRLCWTVVVLQPRLLWIPRNRLEHTRQNTGSQIATTIRRQRPEELRSRARTIPKNDRIQQGNRVPGVVNPTAGAGRTVPCDRDVGRAEGGSPILKNSAPQVIRGISRDRVVG